VIRLLLSALILGALFLGGCVIIAPHEPWGGHFFMFPFLTFPFGLFGIALYLLPTIVAVARGKRNILGIVLVNLLLGWTLIGWIIALVWACTVKD
jgi:hypothetical protein